VTIVRNANGRSLTGAVLRSVGSILLTLTAVFLVWELVVDVAGIRPFYLPRPSVIAYAILATPGAYADAFLKTLAETVLGFGSGSVFGIAIGLLFFRVRLLRELVFPIFILSQTIPVIAFGALVVLWLGNSLLAKAAIAFYLSFFPVAIHTLVGLHSADPKQVQLMRSFGASPAQILFKLQFPVALPKIFVSLKIAASLGLLGAIVGEWFGDTTGLGVILIQAMFSENVTVLYAAILVSALLGTSLYWIISFLERHVVFWRAE
jgi:NitT/TauT family transport system permease protein